MVIMETIAERLKHARKEKGWTQGQLATAAGVSQGAVGNIESGNRQSKSTLIELAEVLEVSYKWLSSGEGAMRESSRHALTKHTPDSVSIPQYNTGGKMGNGLVLRDQAGIINSMNVNNEWIQKNVPHCTSPKNLCIVTGFGDSMQGVFNSGDPLIVDKGVTTCDHDGIYFFRIGSEGFIKRLQRIPSQGILVISDNPNYRDWTITESMDFEVFAKVLRAWRGESY